MKINIGQIPAEVNEKSKALGPHSVWMYDKSNRETLGRHPDKWNSHGGLCLMVLEQELTPGGLRPKLRDKNIVELQHILVKRLVKSGYDFGVQEDEEAIALIERLGGKVSRKKAPAFQQDVTVTVVLRRTAETGEEVGLAKEYTDDAIASHKADIPEGSNRLEQMLGNGYSVVDVTSVVSVKSGSIYSYGWKRGGGN